MRRLPRWVPILSCALAAPVASLGAQKKPVTQPLLTASIAGQGVALLPVTLVIAEAPVRTGELAQERVALIRFADSLFIDGMLTRAPEIQWIPPADLRRMARRSGGLVADPDRMGQSVMRTWSLATVPDPLRSNLRKLVSIAGGSRYAFIPASFVFRADSVAPLRAELSVVLADTRTGKVVWRSVAKGAGGSAAEAIERAIETIFPPEGD